MEIRRSYDHIISTMGFHILVRQYLYIESRPESFKRNCDKDVLCKQKSTFCGCRGPHFRAVHIPSSPALYPWDGSDKSRKSHGNWYTSKNDMILYKDKNNIGSDPFYEWLCPWCFCYARLYFIAWYCVFDVNKTDAWTMDYIVMA